MLISCDKMKFCVSYLKTMQVLEQPKQLLLCKQNLDYRFSTAKYSGNRSFYLFGVDSKVEKGHGSFSSSLKPAFHYLGLSIFLFPMSMSLDQHGNCLVSLLLKLAEEHCSTHAHCVFTGDGDDYACISNLVLTTALAF